MAKVYKRKNKQGKEIGGWCGKYTSATGSRTYVTLYSGKAESQQKLDELAAHARVQSQRLREGVIDITELTIAENADRPFGPIVDRFIDEMNANEMSKRQERCRMNQIVKACKLKTIADYARSASRFQQHLRTLPRTDTDRGLSPRTIRQLKSTYATFGRWATKVDRGYIVTSPGDQIEAPNCPPENDRVPHRAFTVAEFEALISSLNATRDTLGRQLSPKVMADRRDRALSYRLRAFTGLRASETKRIRRSYLDLEASTVRLPMLDSKTRKFDAVLPLPDDLCEALRERFGSVPPETQLWSHGFHKEALQRDLKRAGIALVNAAGEAINARSFRMTQNTWAIAAGLTGIEILLLRRDKGDSASSLILRTYSDKAQRLDAMRTALDKLVAWHTAQLAKRITLAV